MIHPDRYVWKTSTYDMSSDIKMQDISAFSSGYQQLVTQTVMSATCIQMCVDIEVLQ